MVESKRQTPSYFILFALLLGALIVGGCDAGSLDPVLADPDPVPLPPLPDPDPDPVPVPNPNPGNGPMLDPGFAEPTNRIDLNYDSGLSSTQNGDRFKAAMEALQPNDLLVVGAGLYTVSSRILVTVKGTAANPVKIMPADGADVHIHRPSSGRNVVDLDGVSYITIQGIEFSGGNAGIRIGTADHMFIYDNHIHDTGDVGIPVNSGHTSYLYFVQNHVHDTHGYGEGFYIGANFGEWITHHTYVVGNYVHDTSTSGQGDGIEIKDGSYACVISDNLVVNTHYPGIIVYGTQGEPERNIIERNIIINSAEGGIQVAADAIVRNNLIIDARHACIVSQPHQTAVPSNLTIVHNTMVNYGSCLDSSSWDGNNIVFANNALYSSSGQEFTGPGTGVAVLAGNVILDDLASFEDLTLDGTGRDAMPLSSSPLVGAGSSIYAALLDLHQKARSGPLDVGAVDADR